MDYTWPMIEVRETPEFTRWLADLRDQRAVLHIVRRISRVAAGNTGDAKSVGGSVSELRIDYGPGYRVYFTRRGQTLVILLCGGDKRTQSRDIRKAVEIADKLEG
jgi:putative addiction module killer protein